MTRRTVIATVAGLALTGSLVAPALAAAQETRGTTCLLLMPKSGEPEGLCVWVPLPPRSAS